MNWWQNLIRRRKAGVVAVMAGLMAPVLIGFAALSIDGGYWIGSQVALQSQANAGAISAVRAENYGLTATAAISAVANRAALGANSKMAKAAVQTSLAPGSATVTAQNGAPVYLARVLGVTGFTLGAKATAGGAAVNRNITGCLITFSTTASDSIYVSGSSTITGSNCGVIANSSASSQSNGDANAIVADPSGKITAPQILAAGGIYASSSGGTYIGAASGQPSIVIPNGPPVRDPLAAMGDPPAVPTLSMPSIYSSTTDISSTGESFGSSSAWSEPWGGCDSSSDCYLNAGGFDGFSASIASFTFNTGTATPNDASTYTVKGQTSLSGTSKSGQIKLDAGTYYFQGDLTNGVASDYALNVDAPNMTIEAGTKFYAFGGFDFSGSNPDVSFGKGFYYFSAANNNSGYAFTANSSNIDFGGGTYIFNGSVDITAADNVTFGPGIYIISNGTFNLTGGATFTANGATFVLENGANFAFNGNATGNNMSAPTTDCVAPADYPLSAYGGAYPYDGTNGQGICGILFYQARNDSTTDTFSGNAKININGIMYIPSANLILTGGGGPGPTIGPSSSGADVGVLANTVSVTGSSSIVLQTASGSPLDNIQYPSQEPILTK